MQLSDLPRKFVLKFKSTSLEVDDPNPELKNLADVQTLLSMTYPELSSGKIIGPEIKNDCRYFTLSGEQVGVKG